MQEPDPPTMRNGILDTPVWASMRYNEYSHKHQKPRLVRMILFNQYCCVKLLLMIEIFYPTTISE
jgi:hypothetical protein